MKQFRVVKNNFAVNSTTVETPAIARVVRVIKRHPDSDLIAYGAVYNCRPVAGSTTWSQHAWGNAVDFFPTSGGDQNAKRKTIADQLVRQATQATLINFGVRLPIAQVIDHDARRIWQPSTGWIVYTGTLGNHVHVSGYPMFNGSPPCSR